MKKVVSLFCFGVLLSFSNLSAQGFFAHLKLGYGLSTSPDIVGGSSVDSISINNLGSQGAGGMGFLSIGYMIKDYIGFDLAGNYLLGARDLQVRTLNNSANSLDELMMYSRVFSMSPAIILKTPWERIRFTSRLGIQVPMTGITIAERTTMLDQDQNGDRETEVFVSSRTTGRFSLGYTAAVGIEVKLTKKLSFTSDIDLMTLRIKSNKMVTDVWNVTINGETTDMLPDAHTSALEIEFTDELNTATGNIFGQYPDLPLATLYHSYSFNRIGLNAGLKFNF